MNRSMIAATLGFSACLAMGVQGIGNAETVVTMQPGQERVLFDPLPARVLVKNNSDQIGDASIMGIQGPALKSGQTVAGGFQLLDRTLQFDSSIKAGELRARIRMQYPLRTPDGERVNEDTVTLMRLDEQRARWIPAHRAIRDTGRADIRRIPGRADFVLGHYGVDKIGGDVWAVVDVNSSYAIGAQAIPEPVSTGCLVAAGALLLMRRGGKRRRGLESDASSAES